jgi:uncharacterized secreted protein with C-terminal beta-propeller domain
MTLRVPRTAWLSATALLLLAGCTEHPQPARTTHPPAVPAGTIRLAAFDSCAHLLDGLRTSAKAAVGPYGFGGPEYAAGAAAEGAPGARADSAAKGAVPAQPDGGSVPNYSGTNTHEAGVDEPDLVKTDGKRIVTVSGGVLRVVDVATRRITGQVALTEQTGGPRMYNAAELLLSGNRALVLISGGYVPMRGGPATDIAPQPADVLGPRVLLVDLSGAPTITGRYTVDGNLVDARQTGDTARVVVRSSPRLLFPNADRPLTEAQRTAVNEAYLDRTTVDDWLPRYTVDDSTGHHTGRVDCTAVSRPVHYTGSSMLTVLTFDLGRPALGSGDPVTIVADGSTVYGTGPSLYVAGYQDRELPRVQARTTTELYRFDTSKPGRPVFAASGEVPGYLLNQYALAEWNGHLRVATTTAQPWAPPVVDPGAPNAPARPRPPQTESTVYTLTERGGQLVEAGHVGGLGKGERIYAVRFLGGTGYVVTFRQTDPLYTLDLRDASAPRVAGELKINGYSSYLHPAGDGRLLGIGQDATSSGRVQGMQVSLFDVGDPAKPTRLAQYKLGYGYSEAEYEPHAFLYWPATKLLVVPVYQASSGAVALRVGDTAFTELGTVTHPASGQIRRSLVIGDTLWTVSDGGLAADEVRSGATPLARVAWLPYT